MKTAKIPVIIILLLMFASAASAAEISAAVPDTELEPSVTATVPVIIYGAQDVTAYSLYVEELSSGTAVINTSAAYLTGTRFNTDKNKVVLFDITPSINGDTELFSIDVTSAEGENIVVKINVSEVLEGDGYDDYSAKYPGQTVIIPVQGGKTPDLSSYSPSAVPSAQQASAAPTSSSGFLITTALAALSLALSMRHKP